MVLVSVLLVVVPLSVQVVPSVAGFGIMLLGLPIYTFFVMETPWKLRPKIFDRISGDYSLHICIVMNPHLKNVAVPSNRWQIIIIPHSEKFSQM